MKKITLITIVVALVICIATASVAVLLSSTKPSNIPNRPIDKNQDFYVGVTYCGQNTTEAKLLVDKVAPYTNLFVLQSGPLMSNSTAVTEIGDYAVAKELHFAVSFETSRVPEGAQWMSNASGRWSNMFGGVYYADEPAGEMLDAQVNLISSTGETINKLSDGKIRTVNPEIIFCTNGTIFLIKTNSTAEWESGSSFLNSDITYYPDGQVTIIDRLYEMGKYETAGTKQISCNYYTSQNGTSRLAQEPTYQAIQSKNPIPNCTAAADLFINKTSRPLNEFINYWNLGSRSFPIFTSDYALYWWDYKAGYDMVLAQLGWNNTVNQEIALTRGAANLQNKDWGTIITWKYMQAPYLPSGDEMFDQLKASYEAGAKYAIVFNYAKDMTGAYGTLQDEHFEALERFWHEVVENPSVERSGADAVLVLPRDFGWGMRNPTDKIWGIWSANGTSQQIWSVLQDKLSTYGSKLDIVYDDPSFPVESKYSHVYYWDDR